MGTSVAGKIRIDVLANAAQFASGMREGAKQGFGGFQDEMAAFNKKFDAKKAVQERAKKEAEAWKAASAEFRGQGGGFMMQDELSSGFKRDAGLANHVKLQSVIPWGPEFRKGLAKETVQTVQAIGDAKGQLKGAFGGAMKDIASAAVESQGGGGLLGSIAGFAKANPLLIGAAAATAAGAKIAADVRAHRQMVSDTGRDARELGQGVEDVSRLHGAGLDTETLAHAQRSMAEDSDGFKKLGLDAVVEAGKPLREAMLDIAGAMENVRNPADRVRIATELLGRAGADALPPLQTLKEKMDELRGPEVVTATEAAAQRAREKDQKAREQENQGLSLWVGHALGGAEGLGVGDHVGRLQERVVHAWGSLLPGDFGRDQKQRLNAATRRQRSEDEDIRNAGAVEAARVKTEASALAMERAAKAAKEWRKNIEDARRPLDDMGHQMVALAYGEQAAARARFSDSLDARGLGVNTREGAALRREYDQRDAFIRNAQEKKDRDAAVKGAQQQDNPKLKLDEEMKANDKLFENQEIGLRDYATLRMKYLRDYYREAAGLDAKQLAQELRTPAEVFGERIKWLRQAQADGVLTPELEANKKSLADLEAARKQLAGTDEAIGDEDFERQKKKLRQTAVDRLMGQDDENRSVSPIAAMQAGSEGVQRMIAATILTDPKLEIARAANAKLDAIVANTNPDHLEQMLAENAAIATTLDF